MTAVATTERPSSGPRRAVAQRPATRQAPRPVARAAARPAPRRRSRRRNVALRRRIAALLAVVTLAVVVMGLWAMRSEASSDTGPLELAVVVAPGETVWDIANEYLPQGAHPQAYVGEVLRYNDITASAVQPGSVLRLPRP